MVFKPWTEGKTPRHLLQDEPEAFHKSSPPTITINDFTIDNLLIIPSNLEFIRNALSKNYISKAISSISIKKTEINDSEEITFDDNEQLYSAHLDKDTISSSKLDVIQYPDLDLALVTIPIYSNDDIINYNIISKELLKINTKFITITPGSIPFHTPIATLTKTASYPDLVPPFHITGISGALIAKSFILGIHVDSLILQSEGVYGFEKINEDAIDALVNYLIIKFQLKPEFKRDLKNLWYTGKTVDNFGLYV